MLKYEGNAELAEFTGTDFAKYVKTLLTTLENNGVIVKVSGLAKDDWRQPTEIAKIVNLLDSKGDKIVYANYKILPTNFVGENKAYIGDVEYATVEEAIKNCKSGDTIALTGGKYNFTTTEPKTLENVKFTSMAGSEVNGLKVVSDSKSKNLTMNNVTFDGITFTDKVSFGQTSSTNGYSKCSNIKFVNCNFDLKNSTEKYKYAIFRISVGVSGTITTEKQENAYIDGLVVENCTFKNVDCAVYVGKSRSVEIKNCTVENAKNSAFKFTDVTGNITLEGNTVTNANAFLEINTVGNNYSTTDIKAYITIKNNKAYNLTCDNGYAFYTGYDNARQAGNSIYTVKGNECTYTQSFDEPLCGFRIKSTYGPSVAEFIANENN